MRHQNMLKILAAICISILLFIPVNANSAMTYWYGTSGSSVISSDENCPVTVLHEDLLFRLGRQPLPGNSVNKETGKYENSFTAEYTFHNPSDMHVDALLSFPLGQYPNYLENSAVHDDPAQYIITCNDEEIEKKIRYTWMGSRRFSLDELNSLGDTFTDGSFFKASLPVTIYSFTFSYDESQLDEHSLANIRFSFDNENQKRKLMFLPTAHYFENDGDKISAGVYLGSGGTLSVCVFGEDFAEFPEWTFLEGSGENEKEIKGTAELTGTETITYQQYVLRQERGIDDISDVDYYNAFTAMMERYGTENAFIEQPELAFDLMKWLQYELSFEPGETLINSVSAPAFPDINAAYDEPLYEYSYLLSPASSWKEFGTLDVTVDTDQYLISSSIGEFRKTDMGYQAHFKSLPEEELSFRICAIDNPKKPFDWANTALMVIFILIPVLAVILLLVLVIKIIVRILKRRNGEDDL